MDMLWTDKPREGEESLDDSSSEESSTERFEFEELQDLEDITEEIMDQLGSFLDKILKPRYEEDFVDRLNFRVTGYILLAAALTLTAGSWVGKPIQCWVPAQFQGGWEQYVEDYCFVENTYWMPLERRIPTDTTERDTRELNYYQWVPIVLALQALMFNLPHIMWRLLNWLSGVQVRAVVGMATKRELSGESVDKVIGMIAHHIRQAVQVQGAVSGSGNPLSWVFKSCGVMSKSFYVTIVYMFMKTLFLVNLFLQFVILGAFLGTDYNFYGLNILIDLYKGRTWYHTGHFPRVTMCDFQVRQLGNLHRWSVQCVLMINMLNEKVYLFLWWWFLLVILATFCNLVWWLGAIFVGQSSFVRRLLNAHGHPKTTDEGYDEEHDFRKFLNQALRADGVTVLRLITMNAGEVIGSLVVTKMFEDFVKEQQKERGITTSSAPPLPIKVKTDNTNGPKPVFL